MLLVIETALTACSVALLDGARVVAERHEEIGRGHAERLIPMVAELLDEAGIERVDRVLVDVGPGSFTGLRVGVAAAKAFGLAWNVPVDGISSTALVAAGAFAADTRLNRLFVALDAARGQVYIQPFDQGRPAGEIEALDPADAAACAASCDAIAGSGAQLLLQHMPDLRVIAPALPHAADARHVSSDAYRPVAPLYIRAPDARLPA